MLRKFTLLPNKVHGYNRLCGQESELVGYSGPIESDVVDNQGASGPASLMAQFNHATEDRKVDYAREVKTMVNGLQTPKPSHAQVALWHKFKFWFTDDVRLAVPAVSIPNGERRISIKLQEAANMVFEFPNLYIKRTVSTSATNAANRIITYTPVVPASRSFSTDLSLIEIQIYANNIFVSNEIHDIYIKRVGFTLIRVFRHQVTNLTKTGETVKFDQLKWPVEYMFVGLRPVWNVSAANPNQWRDWHRFTYNVDAQYDLKYDIEQCDTGGTPYADSFESTSDFVVPPTYYIPLPTIDSITVESHSIKLFDEFSSDFFNSYLPSHFGGPVLNTPDDTGVFLINFALFPKSYQPSGHFNLSRARETFIKIASSYLSSDRAGDLVVVASALNFLLISFLTIANKRLNRNRKVPMVTCI